MKVRVKAYAPNGASLGVLPTPVSVQASLVLGDTGAMTLEYGTTAPGATLLAAPCELALEVSQDDGMTWSEPDDGRYVYLRRKGDNIKAPAHLTADAAAYSWRLSTAKVLPEGLLNADGKRAFLTATPGTILATLIQEAQTRGALAGMAKDFTTTLDSAGVAWAQSLTIYYSPGMDYLAILRNLFDQGLVDFRFRGRTLQVYNADTVMARRLDAANPIVDLRAGRDITEAPYQGTWEALANFAYVEGEAGVTLERTNVSAYAPWGRQETFIAQGGVSDPGTMTTLADAALEGTAAERMERTYGLALGSARWHPLTDYALGDYVAVGDGSVPLNALAAYRVRQVTLKVDAKGLLDGNVVLNDRFVEQEIRTTRRVTGITGGSSISGGSGATPTPPAAPPVKDTMAPKVVTGLTANSVAYLDPQGFPKAQVTLSWAKVTQNLDGSACDDLDHYDVFRRTNVGGSVWRPLQADIADIAGIVSWSDSPYDVGSSWLFKVRAMDKSGNAPAWTADLGVLMSADVTPPSVPATPTASIRLGVVTVAWSGLDNAGAAMATDTAFVEVHRSAVSGFTPDATTLVGRLARKGMLLFGDQVYGSVWFYRLKSVDTSGNTSGPSVQVSATTTPLVNADLVGTPIDGANVVTDSITTLQLAANSVTADNIGAGVITAGMIAAGTITAGNLSATAVDGKTITGSLIRTAATGKRWEIQSAAASDTIKAFSGLAGETSPGSLTVVNGSTYGEVQLNAPNFGYGGASIAVQSPAPGAANPRSQVSIFGDNGVVGPLSWDQYAVLLQGWSRTEHGSVTHAYGTGVGPVWTTANFITPFNSLPHVTVAIYAATSVGHKFQVWVSGISTSQVTICSRGFNGVAPGAGNYPFHWIASASS